jgi:hypothetical protein
MSVEEKVCVDREVYAKIAELAENLAKSLTELREMLSRTTTVTIIVERREASTGETLSIKEMIVKVIEPGERYDALKVWRLIKEKFNVDTNPISIDSALRALYSKGVLTRVAPGVYTLAKREENERRVRVYRLSSIDIKVLGVIEPGKKYTPRDIMKLLRERGVEIRWGTLYASLTRLTRAGKIRRVSLGLYELAAK